MIAFIALNPQIVVWLLVLHDMFHLVLIFLFFFFFFTMDNLFHTISVITYVLS